MNDKAMFNLTYGLFVLTAEADGKHNGCIINTAQQVTSKPNRVSIAVNKTNHTHDQILKSGKFNKGQLLNMKKLNAFVDQCIENFEIACTGGNENIKFLSGGNIQKVIVAREFSGGANFIIANQPTRGIDVGTADLIRRRLVKTTREDNSAVLLISSDLAEVMEVSDRLLVMKDGEIVAQFNDVKSVTDETLGEYMLGVKRMTPEEMGDLF